MTPSQPSRRAFTLIELMVVIAILANLSAMLLPALSKVKGKGQKVTCINHARQLILAWTMYAHDNEDELPANMDAGEGVPGITNWVGGSMVIPTEATNSAILTDPSRTLLATYLQSAAVFKCPADKSANARSMAMNNRMNPIKPKGGPTAFTAGLGTNFMTFRKLADIQMPSEMFVFLDERSNTINDGFSVST